MRKVQQDSRYIISEKTRSNYMFCSNLVFLLKKIIFRITDKDLLLILNIPNYIIAQQIGPNKLLLIISNHSKFRKRQQKKESITNFRLRACSMVIMVCVMNYLNY